MNRSLEGQDGRNDRTATRPERRDPRMVTQSRIRLIWIMLVINTLGSATSATIIPVPRSVLQVVTMGSLAGAFAISLMINPQLRIRISSVLILLSALLVVSIASSLSLESGLGSLFRCCRLAVFICTLWLLTPWWGNGLAFLRYHLRALIVVLSTVVLGLVVSPGMARPADFDNRLVGAIWPIAATNVADYATVVAGLTIVLWFAGYAPVRNVVLIAVPAIVVLLLTHTRTATIGLVVGLVVAALSLARTSARLRDRVIMGALTSVAVGLAFIGPIAEWLARGQDDEGLSNLTGRQLVWDRLLALDRPPGQLLIGVGLTDKSFGGLPIDSTWLSIYYEQGLIGIAIVALMLLTLIFTALFRPPSPARACAIFLISYGIVASYTQTGLGDATGYLLHIILATILLTPAGSSAPTGSEPEPDPAK